MSDELQNSSIEPDNAIDGCPAKNIADGNHDAEKYHYNLWQAREFFTAKPLLEYLIDLKQEFVGATIEKACILGHIFNNYYDEDMATWNPNGYLLLDEPIVLVANGKRLEMDCLVHSRMKIGVNSLPSTIKSYQDETWRNVDCYMPNIIGTKIVDIVLKTSNKIFDPCMIAAPDRGDAGGNYFSSLLFVLDNGCVLMVYDFIDYMEILYRPLEDYDLFPTDTSLYLGHCEDNKNTTLIFTPQQAGTIMPDDQLCLDEDALYMFHWAIATQIPGFNISSNVNISAATFANILDTWQWILTAPTFDYVIETLCKIDYSTNTVTNTTLLSIINATGHYWNYRDADYCVYTNFRTWFDNIKTSCNDIQFIGVPKEAQS